jgi:integrase
MRAGENPARWRGHLDQILPKPGKAQQHHAAMPYATLPGFLVELREQDGTAARALEFAILTAARTGEILGARWSEIDLAARTWVIPGSRMKAGKEHRIPLSRRAVEILERLPREAGNGHVFIGARRGKPLSAHAMLVLLQEMRPGSAATVHGFRSSFADWAYERTNFSPHEIEMALAHRVGSAVERAYRRGDMLAKRVALMDSWASFCAGEAGTVVTGPWGTAASDAG